jgi:hypothetical protein
MSRTTTYLLILNGAICGFFIIYAFILGHFFTGSRTIRGMAQISSPNKSVLVLGRVLVKSDSDVSTAYDLSRQIQLAPLSQWHPGQP